MDNNWNLIRVRNIKNSGISSSATISIVQLSFFAAGRKGKKFLLARILFRKEKGIETECIVKERSNIMKVSVL